MFSHRIVPERQAVIQDCLAHHRQGDREDAFSGAAVFLAAVLDEAKTVVLAVTRFDDVPRFVNENDFSLNHWLIFDTLDTEKWQHPCPAHDEIPIKRGLETCVIHVFLPSS